VNFETKKDGLRQTQDGLWKLTLTVLPEDMPVELMQAPMGTPYGLAMVKIDYDNPDKPVAEKSEGEKIRTRAVMLCKDSDFQSFSSAVYFNDKDESGAQETIKTTCYINSRSELTTNENAQERFLSLVEDFKAWQLENSYADNLNR